MIDSRVRSVTPRTMEAGLAAGRVLASDVVAPIRPTIATALLDGWAVNAEETLGAGSYTPTVLSSAPSRVEVGQAMPIGTDSVASIDAIKINEQGAEALTSVTHGEGVLPVGADANPNLPLLCAGECLRLTHTAVFAAAGVTRVTVREPRIRVVPLRGTAIIGAAARAIAADIEQRGGSTKLDQNGGGLSAAFAADNADAIVAIGGTGSGRNDNSVLTLAREGEVNAHGIALTPGDTAAFGFVDSRPVLLLPGRLDAALVVWLMIGRHLLECLAGASHKDNVFSEVLTLARKVSSTIGLTEIIPVRRNGTQIEPLASKYLSLSALTRSDGWVLIPPESEGYSAGTSVKVRRWP
jgi:molybdopterin molybdotransferase